MKKLTIETAEDLALKMRNHLRMGANEHTMKSLRNASYLLSMGIGGKGTPVL